ncbi:MAG TPA: DUF6351 family protein [Acidimicrobiia bacterium]|nr:DUF6351 family protein [Acidimicrobiia bacterium]
MIRHPIPESRSNRGRQARPGSARVGASDILKCQFTEMDRTVDPVECTDEEWRRLQAVFPDGVCDWSQAGFGQVPLEGTWLRF